MPCSEFVLFVKSWMRMALFNRKTNYSRDDPLEICFCCFYKTEIRRSADLSSVFNSHKFVRWLFFKHTNVSYLQRRFSFSIQRPPKAYSSPLIVPLLGKKRRKKKLKAVKIQLNITHVHLHCLRSRELNFGRIYLNIYFLRMLDVTMSTQHYVYFTHALLM